MDNMLPSPGPALEELDHALGTPLHALEEDQMIAPSAQEQQNRGGNVYSFTGFTPQNMLSSGNTPHNLLGSTPHNLLSASGATPRGLDQGMLGSGTPQQQTHHYAPVAIPAPPSPAMASMPTPVANDIVPQLQNIVSTVNMVCTLDLKKIALQARNAEYNPRRFAAVIMRIRDPRTTALIFRSGKMVCTGAKSEEQSRLAARKYARIIQKLGFPTKFKDFKIQNMVGSCDVKFPIRLEGLVLTHSQFSSYEPELFPGLIYRMVKPKIVLLIFVSGKVVLTGAKVRGEIYEAFDNMFPILKNFKKQQ